MKSDKIINGNFLRNFLSILLFVLFIVTVLSAVVLYFQIHKPLQLNYGTIISTIAGIKELIMVKTIKINIFFFFLIAAGVGLLSLLYSHRIAGPLYRIKQDTKSIADGKLNTIIQLRRNDALTSFADSINEMATYYKGKTALLSSEIQQMQDEISRLQTLKEGDENTEDSIRKIHALDSNIKELLRSMKV